MGDLRHGANRFMVVHGAGQGHEHLTMAAQRRDLMVLFDDNPHGISLRGPLGVDNLNPLVLAIRDLPYFDHMHVTLFGMPVAISCTGFTGEREYEILCRGQDAPLIWDRIVAEHAEMGIIPCRTTALDLPNAES